MQESNHRAVSSEKSEKRSRHLHFMEDHYFIACNVYGRICIVPSCQETRQAQKVVAVASRRWSFTGGSNRRALTGKIFVFWIGGRLWEVVAYEGWSHMEVRL